MFFCSSSSCTRTRLCSVGLASLVFCWTRCIAFALSSPRACCFRFICWISVRTACKTFATFASATLLRLRCSQVCVRCLARFMWMQMLHCCSPCCPLWFFPQSEKCLCKRRVLQTEHVHCPRFWQAVQTRCPHRVRSHFALLNSFSSRSWSQRSHFFNSLHVKHTR